MRRIFTPISSFVISFALTLSGLVFSPAQAETTYDALTGNGTVDCSVSGYFIIGSFGITGASDCSGDAVIPDGVLRIENSAFYPAPDLVSVTIPASVNTIGISAFRDAPLLVRFTFLGNAPSSVGANAFSWLGTSPKAVVTSDATGFGTEGVNWNGLTIAALTADGDYVCSTGSKTTVETPSSTPRYKITDGVVSTGGSCGGDVVISDGVRSIEHHAFSGAGYITSITFTDDGMLTHIGEYAFEWLGRLKSIVIPASVTTIGLAAFFGDSSLTSMFFLGDDPAAGVDIFWASQPGEYESGTKAYFRTGATGFAQDINEKWNGVPISEFNNIVNFDSKGGSAVSLSPFVIDGNVSAPTAPTRIGYTFSGWSTTDPGTAVTFPYTPGVTSDITLFANWFEDGNFLCSGARAEVDDTNIYNITGGVVSNGGACTGDVVIPEGVTQIGTSAFAGSTITAIDLPASVTYIAQGAFFNSTLESVVFEPNGNLQTIGLEAFRMTKLISISIPEGVQTIQESAFNYIPTLTSVTIPSSVITIDGYNFYASASLNSIFFLGNAPTSIGTAVFTEIGPSPKAYVNAANASSFTIGDDGKWKGLTVVDLAPDGTYDCSTGAATGSTTNIFSILGGVVTGGTCTGPMVIPSGVVAIGPHAFQEQTTLTSITFSGSSNLKSIGVNAFFGATGLTSVVIPNGVTSIGDTAFYGTTSLTSVTVEGNDTSPPLNIGHGAFYNAIKLTSISIPKNVTSIGNNAFDTTTSLTSVTFAEGSLLTSIGNSAFAYAPKLTSITIPENVESIGTNAFEAATSLASIYFLGNAPSVGTDAFSGITTEIKAYIKPTASGFDLDETTGKWNGLTVITVYTYTLTYAYNSATGGNTVASSSFATGDTPITLPTPTRTGYTFAGWYSDAGFTTRIGDAGEDYSPTGVVESLNAYAKWTEIPVLPEPPPSGNPPSGNPPADNTPPVDLVAQAAAADLAARTIKVKSKFAGKALASRVGVKMVSPKAKVTFKISKASKKICTKSGSKIKTLKTGNCVVTFTVQEPKPKKGKKPKATKTVKTLVVN